MRDCMMTSFACSFLFVLAKEKESNTKRKEKRKTILFTQSDCIRRMPMCVCVSVFYKTCACNRMTIRHCHLWFAVLCCCCCQVRKHETLTHTYNSHNEIRLKIGHRMHFTSQMWETLLSLYVKWAHICQHCTTAERGRRPAKRTKYTKNTNIIADRKEFRVRGKESILPWNVKLPDMFICRFLHFLLFFCQFFFLSLRPCCSLISFIYIFWVLIHIYSAWHDNPVIIILQIEYSNNNNARARVCDWWNVCSCAWLLIDTTR